MPILIQTTHGKVIAMQGSALIRGADGKMRALHVGDIVERGDVILTTQNGIVEMKPEAGPNVAATPVANDIDRVITGLNEDNPATATAATLAGDGAGDLSPGLRVDRVVELASASALTQSSGIATGPLPFAGTNTINQTTTPVLTAGSSVVSAVEEGPSVNLGLPAPSGTAAGAVVTVTQVPAIGEVHKADGSVVGAGTVLAVTDLPGLQYVPPADYNGSTNVGDFVYTVSSGGVAASGSASIDLGAVNDAPEATSATASGLEDTALPISLGGQDVDGSIASVTVTAIPSGSTLLLADGVTPVVPGQALTPAAAAGLLFKPSADFNGSTSITFTVTDDAGAVSAPASVDINVIVVNDAPVALADLASTLEDTPVSGNVLANDGDVDGPALSVSGFSVAGSDYAADATAVLPGVGVLAIATDGSYTFTPALNYNGAAPVVTYTATDGTSSSSATLSLSVAPVNDAPVAADDLASTPINTPITIAVLANDLDVEGDSLNVSNAVLADPTQGTLTVNANGTLSFTPANNVAGAVGISYTVTDSHGGSDTASVTVNVGNNTPPTGADSVHALAEDSSYSVQPGDFGLADADAGQTLSNVRIDTLPAAGTLLLNGGAVLTGQVISAADLSAGKLVFLPAADANGAPYASFSFSVQDSAGAFDAAPNTLTLNVTPVNDPPVAVADSASALEAGGLNNEIPGINPSGNVLANDTDIDSGDTKTVSAVVGTAAGTVGGTTAGAFGTLLLNADGSYTYSLDNGNAAVQALRNASNTLTDSFDYTVVDASGATSSATLTVTINGSNDAAVVSAASGAVTEDVAANAAGQLVTGGTVAISDVDAGQAAFVAQPGTAGAYGTFTLAANGAWTYSASNGNPAIQSLGAGQTLTETFAVASIDGSATSNVTVTINGSNDTAVISAASGAVTEDVAVNGAGNLVTGGTVAISDADATQATFVGQPGTAGAYGTFTLASDGTWSYTASNSNPAIQSLGAGQTLTETFAVASLDGSATSNVTVTINGSNDIAVISAASGAVTEDSAVDGAGHLTTGGTLTVSDADAGQAAFVAQPGTGGAYGTFTLAANGSWTYTASNSNAAVQGLGDSDTLTETFAVTSLDGSASSSVTVTIHGSSDIAVISAASGAVTEDVAVDGAGMLSTGGIVDISDADAGQAAFVAQPSTAGAYGTFTLAADGTWTYSASNDNPAIQSLGTGQTLTETFAVVSLDGSASSSVTVAINGSNDAPVATGDSATTPINTAITVDVKANDSDVDNTAAQLGVSNVSLADPAQGSVDLNGDGSITFTPATNFSGPASISYTLTDTDGLSDTATLVVNVGANTPPTGTDFTLTTAEDTPVAIGIADLGFADADLGQTLAAVRIDSLPAAGALLLDGAPIAAGTVVAAADIAAGLLSFAPAANASSNGYASFGFSVQDSAGAFDATPNTATIDVTPVNDAPQAVADADTAVEAGGIANGTAGSDPSGNVLANDTDADSGDTQTVSAISGIAPGVVGGSTTGAFGTLVLDAAGNYTYTLDNSNPSVQALRSASDTLSDSFSYTVRDAAGLTSSTTLTITIEGRNDAPVAFADAGSVAEDDTVVASAAGGVLANDNDVDGGDSLTVSNVSVGASVGSVGSALAGTYGSLTLNADGSYSYLADRPAAQALASGQTANEAFTYTVRDSAGATSTTTLTFTITGTNDAPLASADSQTVAEDNAATGNVLGNDSDADTGAVLSVTQFSVAGVAGSFAAGSVASIAGVGSLLIASDGSYTFTPLANYNGAVPVATYTVSDGTDSTSATLSINVSAVNDAPSGTDKTITLNEDASYTLSRADFGFADNADSPANNFAAVTLDPSSAGTLRLNGTAIAASTTVTVAQLDAGLLTFTPAANANGSGYASFSFAVNDDGGTANGGADTDATPNTITFDVTAVNDAPSGHDATRTINEDTPYTFARADFGFQDAADGNNLLSVSVTPPSAGTLTLNGVTVSAATTVLATQLDAGALQFTPAANASGNGYASFSFAVRDDGGTANGGVDTDTTPNTLTVNVSAVSDAPTGTDKTITLNEDASYTLSRADFGFADSADSPAHNFAAVTLDPSSAGTLRLNGTAIAASTTVTVAQLDAGLLTFTPAANANGSGYASFSFAVKDDGGTANGGADTDTTPNTLTFNVTAVNDAPVGAADGYSAVEGSMTSLSGSVLANDTDIEGASLAVTQVAGSASGTAITADGITTIATALGGTVVMNSDGTFRYIAPVRDHADAVADIDSFVYKASDGSAASTWTTVNISLTETKPIAVADSATVAFNSTVGGNLLFNDLGVDAPLRVTSVTYSGTTQTIASGGSTSFSTASGQIVVSSDGSYTYTSQLGGTAVLTGSSKATWEDSTDLYGFTSGTAWQSGSNLNLSALTSSAGNQAVFVSGSKNGIGVGSTGSGTIGTGEQLIVHLLETSTHATIGIAQLNSNQDPANAHWSAYDASGVLVGSGTFALAASISNGAEYSLDISTASNFAYFRLSWEPSGNSSQGFVLSSLSIDRLPGNHIDSFSYAMADEDNSTATSSLTVTPGSSSSTQSTSLTGTAGSDHLNGDGNDNAITGNGGNDILYGAGGNDTLTSGSGTDALYGGTSNDTLSAGGSNDILVGGAGNDTLTGGSGADVFAWNLADKGGAGTPAVDTITDFNIASPAAGGDQLDLRDLLQGETTVGGTGNLGNYLHFSVAGGDTTIQISSAGGFSGGFQASAVDQTIVLQSVDLSAAGAFTTDQQIIQDLLNKSKLIVDTGP